MDILKNILIGLAVLVILFLGRKLIFRFVKDVFSGVYGKTVGFVSAIIFLGLLGLIIGLFIS